MQYSYIALRRIYFPQCMKQTSQLNWAGEDLVFISCEDFQNYISCSSLDLIIVFAVCHDEGVRGLGVRGGNPARRSIPQDPWLASTASVPRDQAQSFVFPPPQQESKWVKCTLWQDVGVGDRKQWGLFCLATPGCSSWKVGQHRCLDGEVKPQDMLDCHKQAVVFICPSSASTQKDRMAW